MPQTSQTPAIDSGILLPLAASNLPLAIAVLDAKGHCLSANKAFFKMFGLDVRARDEDALPSPLFNLIFESTSVCSDQVDRFTEQLSDLLRSASDDSSPEASVAIRINARRLKMHATVSKGHTYWLTIIDQTKDEISHQELTATNKLLKLREARLLNLALTDQLTQLPNRAGYEIKLAEVLANARTDDSIFALLFIDLDGFKYINDSFGHTTGDELLVEIASRLDATSRKSDTVVRLGGDEFAVIADPMKDQNDIMNLTERLLQECREPMWLNGRSLRISASIGVAIYPSDVKRIDDEDQLERLEQCADLAMYRAKSSGRNKASVFKPEMLKAAIANLETTQALRVAIERNEFSIELQPVYDILANKIIALEALVRWEHPTRGRLLAADFIEIAESSQLIRDIDLKVLELVIQTVDRFSDNWPSGVYVSTNISALNFSDISVVDEILHLFSHYSVPTERVAIEIMERGMLNIATAMPILNKFKSHHIRVLLDDFSVGYSTLAYLNELSFTALKIDHHFIQDIATNTNSAALIEAIINMARTLGLDVIAKSVETNQQLMELRTVGCQFAQGHILSRPIDPESAVAMAVEDVRRQQHIQSSRD